MDSEFDITKVETKSFDEMWKEHEIEWVKKHPIANWVDKVLFKGKGIGSYSPHHALTSFALLKDAWYEIKWAWQRVFRGWDERVAWSIDYYLDEMIPVWLETLIKNKQSCPMMMFEKSDFEEDGYTMKEGILEIRVKEYDEILKRIANGFRLHRKIDDLEFGYNTPEEIAANAEFDECFKLFHKFYETLWD